jgi:hypothetical protein
MDKKRENRFFSFKALRKRAFLMDKIEKKAFCLSTTVEKTSYSGGAAERHFPATSPLSLQ